MRTAIYIWLVLIAASVPVSAQSSQVHTPGTLAELKGALVELKAEYRAHSRARDLMAEMGLFDEFNVLGRTVMVQTQPITHLDDVPPPKEREDFVGTAAQGGYAQPEIEISEGSEFGKDIGGEIKHLQDAIRNLERSVSAIEKGEKP